jgi:hypothetical protein
VKSMKINTAQMCLSSCALVFLCSFIVIGGCTPGQKTASPLTPARVHLTVDFKKGQTLRYRFYSARYNTVNWGKQGEVNSKTDTFQESLRMVISYTPLEVDPYGISTIQAVCESAKVERDERLAAYAPDAAESLAGKKWTFTVDSTGRIHDSSKLYDVLREAGTKAFRPDRGKGLIKDPDMLYDFIASQWFLWDSISSIKNPSAGVRMGDKWKSMLFVPASMLLFDARDVNYRLAEIRPDPNGRIALIESTYTLSYPCPSDWPVPYTDTYQLSGVFGFLRAYQTHNLTGDGGEYFNIDAGRIEKSTQTWKMNVSASMLLPGVTPQLIIEQIMTMELVKSP